MSYWSENIIGNDTILDCRDNLFTIVKISHEDYLNDSSYLEGLTKSKVESSLIDLINFCNESDIQYYWHVLAKWIMQTGAKIDNNQHKVILEKLESFDDSDKFENTSKRRFFLDDLISKFKLHKENKVVILEQECLIEKILGLN